MLRVVFRLLLCLCVVLNGAGYAAASTQMQVTHWSMAVEATVKAANPPCHGMDDNAAAATAAHDGDKPASSHGDKNGCCQSALCTCDCLQHATAAIAIVALATAVQPTGYTASLRETRAAAPPFHNLLRPPIA